MEEHILYELIPCINKAYVCMSHVDSSSQLNLKLNEEKKKVKKKKVKTYANYKSDVLSLGDRTVVDIIWQSFLV